MLNLMYITNKPVVAKIAEATGVDRIFIDLEYIGKNERQGGMDTVQSHHAIEDIKAVSEVLTTAELLVRVNPIHDQTAEYSSSKAEIDDAINNGAQILMLPYFKTIEEVKTFIKLVDGRVKTMLLLETPESADIIDDILEIDGIDNIHIGLNDLSIALNKKFMFELLADGTVETLCQKIKSKGINYGFGGIASLGHGLLYAERVIKEHYRLGSKCSILSRSFCNADKITDIEKIKETFRDGMTKIRNLEKECEENLAAGNTYYFEKNQRKIQQIVELIVNEEIV